MAALAWEMASVGVAGFDMLEKPCFFFFFFLVFGWSSAFAG